MKNRSSLTLSFREDCGGCFKRDLPPPMLSELEMDAVSRHYRLPHSLVVVMASSLDIQKRESVMNLAKALPPSAFGFLGCEPEPVEVTVLDDRIRPSVLFFAAGLMLGVILITCVVVSFLQYHQ